VEATLNTKGVEHPGELLPATVDEDDPATPRQKPRQVFQSAAGQGAAPDLDDHGLLSDAHVR
jgi:hypothetical protein